MSAIEPHEATRAKTVAAGVSIATNFFLTALKFGAAILTGSVSLLSEAFHSLVDLLSSVVVMVSVRAAAAPPDEEHPYGHAKIESVTGLGEGLLLVFVGIGIIAQASRHLVSRANVHQPLLGVGILVLAALSSRAAGLWVNRVGNKHSSNALLANGSHLLGDFWTSFGVLAGLVLVKFTGQSWIDPLVGLFLASMLIATGYKCANNSFQQLIDRRLADEDVVLIRTMVERTEGVISMHRLRTRLSGAVRYIDFHVVVPADWSVVQAHDLVDHIEDELDSQLAPTVIVIHVDPFDAGKAGHPMPLGTRGPKELS